jgi:hypothetical protein
MPRDLESEKATLARMAPLSKESPPDDDQDPLPLHQSHDPDLLVEEKFKKMKDIHPYSLLLNQEDVDECDWLEHVAFDANEAASKEKVGTPSPSPLHPVRIFSAPALLPASRPCTCHALSICITLGQTSGSNLASGTTAVRRPPLFLRPCRGQPSHHPGFLITFIASLPSYFVLHER